jgi:hypothetical protein
MDEENIPIMKTFLILVLTMALASCTVVDNAIRHEFQGHNNQYRPNNRVPMCQRQVSEFNYVYEPCKK